MPDKSKFVFVGLDAASSEKIDSPRYAYWPSVFRAFFQKKSAAVWLSLMLGLTLMAFVQPLFSGYDPQAAANINRPETWNLSPSLDHWFGTDGRGNDMFDVVWSGARTSLSITFIATFINISAGLLFGALWGSSKKLDPYFLALYNLVSNIPGTLRIMILMYILGRGFWQMIAALTLTGWIEVGFFIRTQVMIIRDREYNLASRCLGTTTPRLILHNILPYMVSVVCTLVYNQIPGNINSETILSFLGVGLPSSYPSLGRMIDDYWSYIDTYPHLIGFPMLIMGLITLSFYVVGQRLADASDPRTHR
jgi:oligopeptide transport system permease protein